MLYQTLQAKLNGLDTDELFRHVTGLGQSIAEHGFEHLSTKERYLFIQGLARLPESAVNGLPYLGETTKEHLRSLRQNGLSTYARTAAVLFESLIDRQAIYELKQSPLANGPAVVFVANVGAQVPTPRPTLGYQLRQRRGLVPPFGVYYVASFLTLLGAETRVFNLALGEAEYAELQETIEALGDRLWFVSFVSNFLGEGELNAVYHLSAMLDALRTKDGLSPRLVGGGMGVFFSRNVYLQHTPVRIVIGRYGEPSFGDMIFSSDYSGPRDSRDDVTLFGHIPNLHFPVCKEGGLEMLSTQIQPLSRSERRVLANTFDFRMIPYHEKYWSTGVAISVCSPDDLNISMDLVLSESAADDASTCDEPREWISIRSTDYPLHPANYLLRPKAVKVMTVFGNCPRGCKYCQFTQFDEHIFFLSPQEVVNQFNRSVQAFPDVHLLLVDDDDFLLRKDHCWNVVEMLRQNRPTRDKVFYLEATPMGVEPSILQAMYQVGFRGILLGLESPIERIVRHIGKLGPQHDFESFIQAPRMTYDAGFFTRVTSIPFYPIITEPELVKTLQELVGLINYGISVTVFPLVRALPGTAFARTREHDLMMAEYQVPNGHGKTIELPDYVLPDDPVVRQLSLQSSKGTAAQLQSMLQRHSIVGDYPMPLGVLAFFRSIVQVWRNTPHRSVSDGALDSLRDHIDTTAARLARRHFSQLDVQQSIQDVLSGDGRVALARLDRQLGDEETRAFVLQGLRMFLDFGNEQEAVGALQIAKRVTRNGVTDPILHSSLRHCLKRPLSSSQLATIEDATG
jgi:hypothetical protein